MREIETIIGEKNTEKLFSKFKLETLDETLQYFDHHPLKNLSLNFQK